MRCCIFATCFIVIIVCGRNDCVYSEVLSQYLDISVDESGKSCKKLSEWIPLANLGKSNDHIYCLSNYAKKTINSSAIFERMFAYSEAVGIMEENIEEEGNVESNEASDLSLSIIMGRLENEYNNYKFIGNPEIGDVVLWAPIKENEYGWFIFLKAMVTNNIASEDEDSDEYIYDSLNRGDQREISKKHGWKYISQKNTGEYIYYKIINNKISKKKYMMEKSVNLGNRHGIKIWQINCDTKSAKLVLLREYNRRGELTWNFRTELEYYAIEKDTAKTYGYEHLCK